MTRSRFRALYGASVGNLLVLVLSFAIAGLAVVGWFQRPRDVTTVIEWFVAAVVLHDLVAVPVYTLLDRIVSGSLRHAGRRRTILGAVNATPYLRVPAILSGLLLVVFFPVILGLGSQAELTASGIAEQGYLAKWLIASGVLFGLSGVAWGVAARRGTPAAPHPGPSAAPASEDEPVPAVPDPLEALDPPDPPDSPDSPDSPDRPAPPAPPDPPAPPVP
jgi:hypothetical protein